eukprot:5288703-Lingulodinium_polyedra.AAC.1
MPIAQWFVPAQCAYAPTSVPICNTYVVCMHRPACVCIRTRARSSMDVWNVRQTLAMLFKVYRVFDTRCVF